MKKLCGAKARSKNHQPCQRAAMPNGRCKLHGGLSTGPKTNEGRLKAFHAVFKHGFYSKDQIDARKFLREILSEGQKLIHDTTMS
jgi:hypothetical protein